MSNKLNLIKTILSFKKLKIERKFIWLATKNKKNFVFKVLYKYLLFTVIIETIIDLKLNIMFKKINTLPNLFFANKKFLNKCDIK